MKQVSYDVGRFVECDGCTVNYTESDAQGGVIFGSRAMCGACAPGIEANAKQFGESQDIKARAGAGQTFADFVRAYRNAHGSNSITITSF